METIRRRLHGVLQDIPIYTVEEAEEQGLDTAPWREAQAGQWAITDDGYVTQCLSRKTYYDKYKDRSQDIISMTCGRLWISENKDFSFEERKANRSYYSSNPLPWGERGVRTKKIKMLVHAAAVMWLSSKPLDYNKLADLFYPYSSERVAAIHNVKKLLRSPKVEEMIRKDVERELLGHNMTVAAWLDKGIQILKKAEEKENLTEMRLMWQQFGDILRIKEDQTRELAPGLGNVTIDAISEDLKKLPANGGPSGE